MADITGSMTSVYGKLSVALIRKNVNEFGIIQKLFINDKGIGFAVNKQHMNSGNAIFLPKILCIFKVDR
jgi:hypothetical protein